MSADQPAFTSVLHALTGAKDSIKGASAGLVADLTRSQLLVQHARGLATQAGDFQALQRLVFVANDALFSLASSRQAPDAPLLAALPTLLALAAAAGTDEERGKLVQLCGFWKQRGLVDDLTAARLSAACLPQANLDDGPPADDVYCAVGALPLLVRARGSQAPYTPLSREVVMAAPLSVPSEPAYIQSRLQKFYEDLGRHTAAMDVGAGGDRKEGRGFEASTNTFGDGSHAGSRGGHMGLGSAEAVSADADFDFYATYRAVRLNNPPAPLGQSPMLTLLASRHVLGGTWTTLDD
jgi:hypothetical protein